nr:zinc-binding dehydrogenase [Sphingomonas sp. JUb134]
MIAPQGRFALIDDPKTLDVVPFKRKSVSTHWEFMFTRSMFETADMETQGQILSAIASLVDAGEVRTTLTERFSPRTSSARTRRLRALPHAARSSSRVGSDAVHAHSTSAAPVAPAAPTEREQASALSMPAMCGCGRRFRWVTDIYNRKRP